MATGKDNIGSNGSTISFIGTGDCGPTHGPKDGFPIEQYTELVVPTLQAVDLRFSNCERQYSRRGASTRDASEEQMPHGRQPPEMAKIFTDCGFQAVTIANNHMYDYGPEALLDTRALLLEKGIAVTGAGKDLAQAREPAIVECKGIKVGFLGYSSVMPDGAEAGPNKVGVAKLRVNTTYEGRGPHSPARVLTTPNQEDVDMILEDIRLLRPKVDVLIVALHWGSAFIPRVIADYQVTAGHAIIDAGADMIIGHHPHILKAIEVYKGKAIFYSLNALCMTKPTPNRAWSSKPWEHGALRNHQDLDPTMPLYPYGRHSARSLLAKAVFSKKGVESVSFIPLWTDTKYRPEVLIRSDPRFQDMIEYMDWCSEGFEHRFVAEGDEVRVC